MTTLDRILPAAVSEMGKIKIGTLRPGARNPMEKLDHFLITTTDRDANGVLIPDDALMEALAAYRDPVSKHDAKARLRAVPVLFPSNAIEDVLQVRYEWWPGKTRIGATSTSLVRGDEFVDRSQIAVTFFCDPKTGDPLPRPEVRQWDETLLALPDPKAQRPLLSLSTTLSVMIASPAARYGGVYRFRTKGFHSTTQLVGCLQHIKRNLTFGILRGPVFKLVVRPKTVRPKGVVGVAQVVHVECDHNDIAQLRAAVRESALYERENLQIVAETAQQYRALAAAAVTDEDGDDEQVVQAAAPAAPPRQVTTTAPSPPVAGEVAPADPEPEPAPPVTKEEFVALIKQKGWGWRAAVRAMNKNFGTDHPDNAAWASVDAAHVADFAAWLRTQDDVAPAEQPAPAPTAEVPASAPTPAAQPAATAPAKASKAIVDAILKLCVALGGSWEDARAAHADELGITCGRAADLTPEQATKLHAALKAALAAREPQPA